MEPVPAVREIDQDDEVSGGTVVAGSGTGRLAGEHAHWIARGIDLATLPTCSQFDPQNKHGVLSPYA